MKKLLLLVFLINFAFSACEDGHLAKPQTNQSLADFNKDEAKIAGEIKKLNDKFKEEVLKIEKLSLKERENLLNLAKNKALKEQEKLFLLKTNNELEALINNALTN